MIPATPTSGSPARPATAAARILRRGYSYTDGIDPRPGELDAGLFFICFQRDPHRAVRRDPAAARQRRRLNEYIQHTSSGLFAVPPGTAAGRPVADRLFD